MYHFNIWLISSLIHFICDLTALIFHIWIDYPIVYMILCCLPLSPTMGGKKSLSIQTLAPKCRQVTYNYFSLMLWDIFTWACDTRSRDIWRTWYHSSKDGCGIQNRNGRVLTRSFCSGLVSIETSRYATESSLYRSFLSKLISSPPIKYMYCPVT